MKVMWVIALGLGAGGAHAAKLACYEDPRTAAMTCIDERSVRESDPGIRYSPFYTGGPKGVRKTSYTLHTNCVTGVTHLKDRDGVSFGGGYGDETQSVQSLRRWICEAPLQGKRPR